MKPINKMFRLAVVAIAMISLTPAYAQSEKADVKSMRKEAKREVFKRSPKEARKAAKKLEREGWKTMGLPIEKQLELTWERIATIDAQTGYPKYIYTETQANGQSFSAAQMQAESIAKVQIAEKIASSVASLTDIALANQEVSPSESVSIQEVVRNAKVLVSQKLGRVFTSECIYQQTKNQYTVRVVVLYDMAQAAEVTKQVLEEQLKDKLNENGKILDGITGLDKFANAVQEFDEEL